MYGVILKKIVVKQIRKLPEYVRMDLAALLEDLRIFGPIQKKWKNFCSIGDNKYHCHLSRKWAACWYCEKDSIKIEVYYAGSRENAPY